MVMRRTVVNIDDEALREAQRLLETSTMTETVNEALREVARVRGIDSYVELEAKVAASIDDPEAERRRAWSGQ